MNNYFKQHNINNLKNLKSYLTAIRTDCAFLIATYTGMRIGEICALPYKCLEKIPDNQGRLVNLIGSTFKLYGVKKKARWLAPSEINISVQILQKISKTIWKKNKCKGDPEYLFIPIQSIGPQSKCSIETLSTPLTGVAQTQLVKPLKVERQDIKELIENNPFLDYEHDGYVTIGEPWPLSAHQFRRSLAVYASQSGVVSLSTLKKQFKHITKEMTLYYSKDASNNNSLFMSKENKDHFANEFQKTKPEADALAYIKNVLLSEKELFGAHGIWLKQRTKGKGVIIIDRDDINKRFKNGELSYKETPLGACLGVEPCDKKLFGLVSACITCSKGIIEPEKLNNAITIQEISTKNPNLEDFEKRLETEQLEELKTALKNINKRSL